MNADLAEQRHQVLSLFDVSRETVTRLDALVEDLVRWQRIKNLVGPSAMPEIWTRHIADSLQLQAFAPHQGPWLDIGSGGGFPGLVIAVLRTELGLGAVHMIESNGRKCAFLRHVVGSLGLDAVVHEQRIERKIPELTEPFGYVSARAVAPLSQLIDWTKDLLRKGALGIFPKGQDVEMELHDASTSWEFSADIRPSLTHPDGRIVLVRMLQT